MSEMPNSIGSGNQNDQQNNGEDTSAPHRMWFLILIAIVAALVMILYFKPVLDSSQKLQTSLIGQYGYSPYGYVQPPVSTFPEARLSFRITASGSQVSPLINVPTTYYVTLVNEETQSVPVYGTVVQVRMVDAPFMIAPTTTDPQNVHLFSTFGFEAAQYDVGSATIIYAGSNVTVPKVLEADSEVFLFGFTGTYHTSGIKSFMISRGQMFLTSLRLDQNGDIVLQQGQPEFDLQNIAISFRIRESEHDLSGAGAIPDGMVDLDDMMELMRNWSER